MPVTSEIDPGGALLFGLMFGVPACIAAAYFGRKRWQHKASEGWPLVPAAYEGAGVDVWLRTQHGVSLYYVWLNFSYEVAGETYRGRYKKRLPGAESKGYMPTRSRGVLNKVRSTFAIIPPNHEST